MSTQVIGQRLAQLRSELAGADEKKWSRVRLAEATGLTLNTLTRMENAGAGTIEVLTTLLTFYHDRGYNPTWIVLPDNSAVSKWRIADEAKAVPVAMVTAELSKLRGRLQQRANDLLKELAE